MKIYCLGCFYTKLNHQETILGMPIEYTVNPKKQIKDYVYSTMDIISADAFYNFGVRRTVWNETFKYFLIYMH